jgi:hypothetical protein
VKALYEYEATAPGELTIHEDDVLLAFDMEEEWMLVQSQKEGEGAGFVPGNYVEAMSEDKPEPAPVQNVIAPPSVCFLHLFHLLLSTQPLLCPTYIESEAREYLRRSRRPGGSFQSHGG